MTETVVRLLYTPRQAAEALGISRSTLYGLLAAGGLESVRIGKARRIPAEVLIDYVAALRSHSQPGTAGR